MYVHIGTRPFGKCDVVPELFYVATWFFHVNFVPLVPLGTRLVLAKAGEKYYVVNIRFSLKSLLFAWLRMGLLAGAVVTGIMAIVGFTDKRPVPEIDGPVMLTIAALLALLFAVVMIYPRRKMPSYERACELAKCAKLDDRGWAALNVLYGRDVMDRPGEVDALTVR
jgi:hypothetical protein